MIRGMVCAVVMAGAAWGQPFEAASIKQRLLPTGTSGDWNPISNPIRISGNRVNVPMAPLAVLVQAAHDVKSYQVSGGRGWAAARGGDLWDIAAISRGDGRAEGDGAVSMEQARVLLQNLLAERFHLKLRHETKEIAVYNLVVAKGGTKLKPVPEDAPMDPKMQRMSLETIVRTTSNSLGRPVINKTGLAGMYEVKRNREADRAADAAEATLEDVLGLKAEAAKVTMDTLVIESAEKPTEN